MNQDNHLSLRKEACFIWLPSWGSRKSKRDCLAVCPWGGKDCLHLFFVRVSLSSCPMRWLTFAYQSKCGHHNCAIRHLGPGRPPGRRHSTMRMGTLEKRGCAHWVSHVGIPSCAVFLGCRCLTVTGRSAEDCSWVTRSQGVLLKKMRHYWLVWLPRPQSRWRTRGYTRQCRCVHRNSMPSLKVSLMVSPWSTLKEISSARTARHIDCVKHSKIPLKMSMQLKHSFMHRLSVRWVVKQNRILW